VERDVMSPLDRNAVGVMVGCVLDYEIVGTQPPTLLLQSQQQDY